MRPGHGVPRLPSSDRQQIYPVASILLPRRLRRPVRIIYRFFREADQIADDPSLDLASRQARLRPYHAALEAACTDVSAQSALLELVDSAPPAVFELIQVIAVHQLPVLPFLKLMGAIEASTSFSRFETDAQLQAYCRIATNPVGEILLRLYSAASVDNLRYSDAICTALLIIDSLQDVAEDWELGRIYIPLDEMQRFGVSERHIEQAKCDAQWRSLMAFEADKARRALLSGRPLGRRLMGRLGLELELIIQGGLRALERLERCQYDVFRNSTSLTRVDRLVVLGRCLRARMEGDT